MGWHRPQRSWDRPQGHGACLCRCAGARCGGRFRRAFREVSHWASAGGHPATRRLHHNFGGGVSSILREQCRPHESRSTLCRPGAHGCLFVRRTNHSGCLALQTIMVCGLETRSDDQSRPGAISGKAHECDHRGVECRSPVSSISFQRDRRLDLGCCGSARVASPDSFPSQEKSQIASNRRSRQ